MPITYSEVKTYWNNNLCNGGWLHELDGDIKGRKLLEIGCGSGNDAVKIIENGCKYVGIDITETAVWHTKLRIGNKGIVSLMNAEYLDFPDHYFDIVYSWGVIHHTVNPQRVIQEIYRVLKPGGLLAVMLYNKFSVRYIFDIMFVRKILWWFRYHRYDDLRRTNPHPSKEQWVSWNTDNLGCPIGRAYNSREVKELLRDFKIEETHLFRQGWFRFILAKPKE